MGGGWALGRGRGGGAGATAAGGEGLVDAGPGWPPAVRGWGSLPSLRRLVKLMGTGKTVKQMYLL